MHFLLHAKKSCGCLHSPRSGLCQPCGTLSAQGRLSEAALASKAVALLANLEFAVQPDRICCEGVSLHCKRTNAGRDRAD